MRRIVAAVLAATAATAISVPPALARSAAARLQGNFTLKGRITAAAHVLGVHTGQRFRRKWTFVPLCPTGACNTVRLIRAVRGGTDRLRLRRRRPGYYVGTGRLYVPLKCGDKTYAKGWAVPFTITVRVTSKSAVGGVVVATAIKATYTNTHRTNLTPCVTVPGHVSAKYEGRLVA
jgi:hypothetical protein